MDVGEGPLLVAGVPGHVDRPHRADVERGARRDVQRGPVSLNNINTSGLLQSRPPGRLLTARSVREDISL